MSRLRPYPVLQRRIPFMSRVVHVTLADSGELVEILIVGRHTRREALEAAAACVAPRRGFAHLKSEEAL